MSWSLFTSRRKLKRLGRYLNKREELTLGHFKVSDYVINDDYGVVLHIREKWQAEVVNVQEGYRHASQAEKERYHEAVKTE